METKLISREDCEHVIQKCIGNKKFEILTFKTKAFEDKEREYYKPDATLEVSAKIIKNVSRFRFFLKNCLTKYTPLNNLFNSVRLYEKERLFYEDFVPKLKAALEFYEIDFVPQYFLSTSKKAMIMEDMSLKFYVSCKRPNPHNLDRFHIELALKATAKLHAGSFAYEQKQITDSNPCPLADTDCILQDLFFKKEEDNSLGYKAVLCGVDCIKKLLSEIEPKVQMVDEKVDALLEYCLEVLKPSANYRSAICHGNLNTRNLLYKYEANTPIDCCLLNFGHLRYFPPAYDLLTLIFFTTTRLFRQHYYTYLVKYYHKCLHDELLKQDLDLHVDQILPFVELQSSINYLLPVIKLKRILHLLDFGAKDGFYKVIKKNEEEYGKFLFEDKADFVREMIRKDPLFKDLITEALEELLEVLKSPRFSRENCYEILEERLLTTVYDLHSFDIRSDPEEEICIEVTLAVLTDNKQEKADEYKYQVKLNENNTLTVLKQNE